MVEVNPSLSVINFNVTVLNTPIKRQRLAEWIKNRDLTISCLQGNNFIIFKFFYF